MKRGNRLVLILALCAAGCPPAEASYPGVDTGICEGRLTLTTATPVTTSDVTGAGTIYFTPYKGDKVSLYDGTQWTMFTFSEISLSLTLTSGKNYDVFLYNNAGTLTLELSSAWTNDTTRATALVLQNGVYVKSGATTRRYLGTIRASGTNTTEDSAANRFVWNYYNRVLRFLKVVDTTDSWTYTTATWRSANNSTSNRVNVLIGKSEDFVHAHVHTINYNASIPFVAGGIGIDSTSANSAQVMGGFYDATDCDYLGYLADGFHFLQWLEYSDATGTTTWYGDAGRSFEQSGLIADLLG